MFIQWLEFKNKTTGQEITHVDFDQINLLVGFSGAGKTQILRTITDFFQAVRFGKPISISCYLRIKFSVEPILDAVGELHSYVWEVETGERFIPSDKDGSDGGLMYTYETLSDDSGIVFERREGQDLRLRGYLQIPAISPLQSVMTVFNGQEDILRIRESIQNSFTLLNQNSAFLPLSQKTFEQLKALMPADLETAEIAKKVFLQQAIHPLAFTLYVAKNLLPDAFAAYLDDVRSVFPALDDVAMQYNSSEQAYELEIMQNGHWILQRDISSGMLKTIHLLAVIHFRPSNSLLLFDELENGLGVNCLDTVVERMKLKAFEEHMQLIVTSHHPYIINQIDDRDWLIVSQKNGVISAKRAVEAGIGKTKQDKFFQLMNYMQRQWL